MTTPANAFNLSSPAAGGTGLRMPSAGSLDGIAQQASRSINMSSAMPIPPLNFTSTASSRSGDIYDTFSGGGMGAGFSVNYGSGLGVGAGQSGLMWLAAAAVVGVWLWKRST